jgi:glycosyltransferase involved in cell wall biosynthesis
MSNDISVLIPVYNGARYLSECIQSVRNQTLPAAEIIIIDDGSKDATPEVASAWGSAVRYERVVHGGLPYARNHGLRFAQTDFVAFIDSDDIWLPEKLELQMAAMLLAAEPAMIFGYVQQFVSDDLRPEEAAKLHFKAEPLRGRIASTLLMRKSDCERAGSFDETLQTGEFIEWYSRANDAGIATILIPKLICRRRLHLHNFGRGDAALNGGYARVMKKVLDRRRKKE